MQAGISKPAKTLQLSLTWSLNGNFQKKLLSFLIDSFPLKPVWNNASCGTKLTTDIKLFMCLQCQENADTSNQVPNSLENERVQRKRASTNRAELEESRASGSKKRKAQSSSSKGRTQKSKTKPVKKATDQDESVSSITAVAQQRSKHHNQSTSNQMSTSDSDGSLNLSDKRDSLILHDTDEHQNDRSFLQQQIKILKTPFQLEEACPALANIRGTTFALVIHSFTCI